MIDTICIMAYFACFKDHVIAEYSAKEMAFAIFNETLQKETFSRKGYLLGHLIETSLDKDEFSRYHKIIQENSFMETCFAFGAWP